MRILVDENLDIHVPKTLGAFFRQHRWESVAFVHSLGLEDGELIRGAKAAGFDMLLTLDLAQMTESTQERRALAETGLKWLGLEDVRAPRGLHGRSRRVASIVAAWPKVAGMFAIGAQAVRIRTVPTDDKARIAQVWHPAEI